MKGGTSATAGKKSEVIAGRGFSARVFHGQRVLYVFPDREEPRVTSCKDMKQAKEYGWIRPDGTPRTDGGQIFWCETVDDQPFTPPEA